MKLKYLRIKTSVCELDKILKTHKICSIYMMLKYIFTNCVFNFYIYIVNSRCNEPREEIFRKKFVISSSLHQKFSKFKILASNVRFSSKGGIQQVRVGQKLSKFDFKAY